VTHEHHDVVVREGGGGFSSGLILGIILVVLVIVVAIWYFGLGGFARGQTQEGGGSEQVPVPSVPAPSY
jgi:hypothetical protein